MKSTLPPEITDFESALLYFVNIIRNASENQINPIEVESNIVEMYQNWIEEFNQLNKNNDIDKELGERYLDMLMAAKIAQQALDKSRKILKADENLYESQDDKDIFELKLNSLLNLCKIISQ